MDGKPLLMSQGQAIKIKVQSSNIWTFQIFVLHENSIDQGPSQRHFFLWHYKKKKKKRLDCAKKGRFNLKTHNIP